MTGRTVIPGVWRKRAHQALAVARLEARKCFVGRRLIAVYLLNILPVLTLVAAVIVQQAMGRRISPERLSQGFAVLYQTFVLRFVIFFSCLAVFTQLFRGEMLEKTIHYYFLAPLRREVVIAGKFLAGALATSLLCGTSVVLSYFLMFGRLGRDGIDSFYSAGPGVQHLIAYLGATILACVGYGAALTLLGVLFRNPIVPALVLLGWEYVLFLLPQFLKQISVVHYVSSLLPLRMSEGPFAILAEPASPLVSITGLLALAVVALVLAGLRARRMEIAYSTD